MTAVFGGWGAVDKQGPEVWPLIGRAHLDRGMAHRGDEGRETREDSRGFASQRCPGQGL